MRKILGYAFILMLIGMFYGCSAGQTIVRPEVQYKVEYRDRITRDTVAVRDSVFVMMRSDTVYVTKWKEIYKEKVRVDTSYVYSTDTIYRVQTIEKRLTKCEQMKMKVGGYGLFALIALICGGLMYVAYKIFGR